MNADEQYKKFIEEHYKLLFSSAFQTMKHDPGTAEGIVNEAVIRLIPHWAEKGSLTVGYAMTTVHNLCLDHFRKMNRLKEDLTADMPDGTVPSIEFDYGNILIDHEVYDAVAELTPALRNVIFMTYWQNLKPAKIAKILNISPARVSNDLDRAKGKLRKALSHRSTKKEG